MKEADIYLASRSQRRRRLLEQIGVRYLTLDVEITEIQHTDEVPEEFVQRMALQKATVGWNALDETERRPVLGADTIVVVDGHTLMKPVDVPDARRQLDRLSGRSHEVLSAVAVVNDTRSVRVNASTVWFRHLEPQECAAYCATGEPMDKAGSYAIQGMAATFIIRIEGSYSGVMGLPLYETAQLLAQHGIRVLRRAPLLKGTGG
jgi:septum formation protein